MKERMEGRKKLWKVQKKYKTKRIKERYKQAIKRGEGRRNEEKHTTN